MAVPADLRARRVAEWFDRPCHAGPVDGADRIGEAAADGLLVRIGIWTDAGARKARFRSTTCASLIAFAEAACEALERGMLPDERALQGLVQDVHPSHLARAALVAAAVRAAFT